MTSIVKQSISTNNAPKALGPYSQAVVVGNFIFVSGQLGLNPQTGEFVEGGISSQTKQALQNITEILKEAGSDISQVVKTTVFLKNITDFKDMNQVYGTFFTNIPPARSTVAVVALPKDALCEIECVAIIPY